MTKQFRYFTFNEFEKASSSKVPNDYIDNAYKVLNICDELRHRYGKPLKILQGGAYRDTSFNQKIGGSPKSRHLIAQAMDLRPVNDCNEDQINILKDIAEQLSLDLNIGLGIGTYLRDTASFIHIDCRPNKARWKEGN